MLKACCERFEKAIKSIDLIKLESAPSTHERLDHVKTLLQELLASHRDEAGDASWES